ncbi:hypothetical protein D9611_013946 [Ephemerocybe angulata]|uniref:F-box domain-containing protein n=1 Tax=Ephemerocybe angulata TaxID=980116 RepID=A0A8H5ARC0_9AGAR|nr:hypothetical protein D9611_013946 [Tulosesus angulatus]
MSEDETPSISYLLDSNTPPKPVEIPVVEGRICELEVELERHRAILSPVRRVPREVLGHIFTFLDPYEHEEKVRNAVGRADFVSLPLSCVCKLWREATLVTHELWTGLKIRPRHTLESLESVEAWFSRAGSLPRRLPYQGWNLRDGEASTNISRQSCSCGSSNAWTWTRRGPGSCLLAASVLPQLLTNGPRLDHLTLMCANTVCFGHFLDTMDALRQISTTPGSRPWDTLRSLSVKFQNTILLPDPQLGHIIVTHLERLPVVESLEVHIPSSSSVFETGFDTSHLELNILPNLLERLTTFEICCSWAGPHILKLLRHCSNIETLTINYGSSGDSPLRNMGGHALIQHYRTAPLVLAKLRTLRTRRARHLSFLYFLEAPQLVNLDIGIFSHENGLNGYDLLLPFQSFRDRSGFTQSLRTFQLRACFIDAGQLFPIISNLTGLTTLTLDNVKVEMDRLWKKFKDRDAAAQRGYGDLSFSNLEKLEILQHPPGCQLEPIVDYIKERGPSLKFQLITSYKIPEHRVLSEEDVRQSLRFSLSGVQASIVLSI